MTVALAMCVKCCRTILELEAIPFDASKLATTFVAPSVTP